MIFELREFVRGAWALGAGWRVWMFLLVAVNGIGPLFFLPHLAAATMLVATAMALVMGLIVVRVQQRYTKLLGVIHAPWVPALLVALHEFTHLPDRFDDYKTWLACSIVMTVGSLLIDATDVLRFLKSTPPLPERTE